VGFILNKARFYESFAEKMNPRQEKAIARMFIEGHKGFEGGMSTRKYMVITKCAQATAARDLAALTKIDAMTCHGRGRSTYYEIAYPKLNRVFSECSHNGVRGLTD
jgi:Fic family protein